MITPGDIQRRALRHYYEWLEGIAAGAADFVPLVIKRTGDVRTIDEGRLETMDEVVANSKSKKGYGYNVILDSPGPRSINQQSRIAAIEIETAADLLQFLDKNHEFEQYQRSLALIQSNAAISGMVYSKCTGDMSLRRNLALIVIRAAFF
ncbi:MAG: hypothetical protein IPK76_07135 [Lewinellaceae bacterium]|nr:hypothetical protein [Lewinellaceae bacterium]